MVGKRKAAEEKKKKTGDRNIKKFDKNSLEELKLHK
jgi:hypothetical protein